MIERRTVGVLILAMLFLGGCAKEAEVAVQTALPDPESNGAKLVKNFCSQCHGPPRPASHAAKEWPNILTRMNDRRMKLAMKPFSDVERVIILDYMQKHAGQS